ncbi:hypothetical protein BC826DRAFT_1106664 [Russula brevipes]|nr:hypothetical protein BC826DRAFT_1106664 [Russula brevipes]
MAPPRPKPSLGIHPVDGQNPLKSKETILVYGHFDVQPAQQSDGRGVPPFQLTRDDQTGCLYGRSSSDGKGPIFGWINGMEESGSEGLGAKTVIPAKVTDKFSIRLVPPPSLAREHAAIRSTTLVPAATATALLLCPRLRRPPQSPSATCSPAWQACT